jgi:hypothetical protein
MARAVDLEILGAAMAELPQDRQATQEEVLRHIVYNKIENNNMSMKITDMTCPIKRDGNVWTSQCAMRDECTIRPCLLRQVNDLITACFERHLQVKAGWLAAGLETVADRTIIARAESLQVQLQKIKKTSRVTAKNLTDRTSFINKITNARFEIGAPVAARLVSFLVLFLFLFLFSFPVLFLVMVT